FQYGKGKVQAVAAVIEGTVITLSGFYISILSFQ
ncbi:MAG TPA: cation transporter, partial [Thiomicrorhabdus sp.]|nr:cation transporter [Thiomicrorhabdus sp.]